MVLHLALQDAIAPEIEEVGEETPQQLAEWAP